MLRQRLEVLQIVWKRTEDIWKQQVNADWPATEVFSGFLLFSAVEGRKEDFLLCLGVFLSPQDTWAGRGGGGETG